MTYPLSGMDFVWQELIKKQQPVSVFTDRLIYLLALPSSCFPGKGKKLS
jgi:hypothetical protein